MTEPSDLARDVLARYRQSISPSGRQRDALVEGVVRRVSGGPGSGGGGGGAAQRASWAPWLAVVGAAFVIVGGAMWAARAPAVGSVDPAFDRAAVLPRTQVETPPAIAVASVDAVPVIDPVDTRAVPRIPAASQMPPSPVTSRPRTTRPPTRTSVAATPVPQPALVDEEVRLLREANVALREGRDAIARAYFDEHARRFEGGALVELREVGRAIMRCRGASADVAAETVAAFRDRFPASPHLARLARECPTTDTR